MLSLICLFIYKIKFLVKVNITVWFPIKFLIRIVCYVALSLHFQQSWNWWISNHTSVMECASDEPKCGVHGLKWWISILTSQIVWPSLLWVHNILWLIALLKCSTLLQFLLSVICKARLLICRTGGGGAEKKNVFRFFWQQLLIENSYFKIQNDYKEFRILKYARNIHIYIYISLRIAC